MRGWARTDKTALTKKAKGKPTIFDNDDPPRWNVARSLARGILFAKCGRKRPIVVLCNVCGDLLPILLHVVLWWVELWEWSGVGG